MPVSTRRRTLMAAAAEEEPSSASDANEATSEITTGLGQVQIQDKYDRVQWV